MEEKQLRATYSGTVQGGIISPILANIYLNELDKKVMAMKLWFMGGGACLIRHFGKSDPKRVMILDDIRATAKGYQRLAVKALRKRGVAFEE